MLEEEKQGFTPPEDDPEYINRLLSLLKESVEVYRAAEEKTEKKNEMAQRNALVEVEKAKESEVAKPFSETQVPSESLGEPEGAFRHEEIFFEAPVSNPSTVEEPVEVIKEAEEINGDKDPDKPEEAEDEAETPEETEEPIEEPIEENEEMEAVKAEETIEEARTEEAIEEIEEAAEAEKSEAPQPIEAIEETVEETEVIEEAEDIVPFISDAVFAPLSNTLSEEEESLPVKKEEARQNKTEEWEAITLDSEIDALIAESREKKSEREAPFFTREEEKAASFSSVAISVTPDADVARLPQEAVILEKEESPLAEETVAPPHRVRRFSMRLLSRRTALREGRAVSVQDAGVSSPLLSPTEEDGGEDFVGTLRPQDFFIADMKEDESLLAENGEYVSRNQIENILSKYANEEKQLGIRFFLSVVLSVLLLVFENLPLFGIDRFSLFGISSVVSVLLDIGLLLAVCCLAFDFFREGFSEIASLRIGESGLVVLSLLLSFLGSLFNLCAGLDLLCALPGAVFVSVSLYLRRMRCKDEVITFTELCKSGDKLAAEDIPAVYASEESAALDKHIKDVVRIKKVGFINGYFRRMKKKCEDLSLHSLLLLIGFCTTVLTTILYALLAKGSAMSGVASLAFYLLFSLLSTILLTARRVPFHHLVGCADEMGTAVIGESSAEDYAAVDAICFEDVEAYPSRKVRVRQIKIYENGKLDDVLYYMASVFSILGGPLDGVFRVSAAELGISENATLLSSSADGFEASVDGVRITAGKSTFFPKEKIYAYYDGGDAFEEDCGNISVMYVAVDGVINAKFCIEYTISRQFERNVARLRRYKVAPLLRSFDPNISNLLLLRTLHNPSLQIRAVRKRVDQLYDFAESRIDSGLVSTRGSKELLKTLFLCQGYRRACRIGRILKMAAVPIGLFFGLTVSATLSPLFFSVYAAALQLFWLLPPYITSRIYFQKRKKTK